MVQKIKGKNNKTNVHHLIDGHDTLTSEQDISNKLGQIFSQNSSRPIIRRFGMVFTRFWNRNDIS
jgi:hypothetical protein